VVSPVFTGTFSIGQLVMILAIAAPNAQPSQYLNNATDARPVARRYFLRSMWGENPGWLWHQPGFPVHRIGSKGANQKSNPAHVHPRRLQNAQPDPDQIRASGQAKAAG
jgi:hypothetical protein